MIDLLMIYRFINITYRYIRNILRMLNLNSVGQSIGHLKLAVNIMLLTELHRAVKMKLPISISAFFFFFFEP